MIKTDLHNAQLKIVICFYSANLTHDNFWSPSPAMPTFITLNNYNWTQFLKYIDSYSRNENVSKRTAIKAVSN